MERASSTGNLAQALAPRPATQVETCLRTLDAEIVALDKAIETHMEKIAPVLRVAEPRADGGQCQPPEEILCPNADAIRGLTKHITSLRLRLESLTDRTEA